MFYEIGFCDHDFYPIYIYKDGIQLKANVYYEDLYGFIICLEFFGYVEL